MDFADLTVTLDLPSKGIAPIDVNVLTGMSLGPVAAGAPEPDFPAPMLTLTGKAKSR